MTTAEQILKLEEEFEAIRKGGSIERQLEILKEIKKLKSEDEN